MPPIQRKPRIWLTSLGEAMALVARIVFITALMVMIVGAAWVVLFSVDVP